MSDAKPRPSEALIIFLVGAVQFVNILDFVMVMPLGPDFAVALGIPNEKLGLIGGSYTAAAAVSGLAGSLFLDRFDRRSALRVAMLGLVAGTFGGGLAKNLYGLMAARVIAGLFGGPATSLAFSIIADEIPNERRGAAMGSVMGAFSIAQIFGVPAGLKLAEWGNWRTPFFAVAGLGLLIAIAATFLLPSMRRHLEARGSAEPPPLIDLLSRPLTWMSYAMTATVMMAGFLVIPNIATYVQKNLHYPRNRLDILYLAGGAASFVTLRLVGKLVDRFGSFKLGTVGSLLLAVVLYVGFYRYYPQVPVWALFVGFMIAMAFRNVAYNTLTSKVPPPAERARFMSIQSAVQHAASSAGAIWSSSLLRTTPDGALLGMPSLATASIALTCVLPALLWIVESRVRARPGPATPPA